MPTKFLTPTISTETCSATDLANDNSSNINSIAIDHDYAINPMGRKSDDMNYKQNQLSPPSLSSENSDIGYESMSSPEPIQSTSTDQVLATEEQLFTLFSLDDQMDNMLNLDNLNIDQDDLLFPTTNTDNDNCHQYPNEIDFICEDNLQPSINDMMSFDSDLHDLFPELF
ncbi:hypothetical protein BLA29_004537 [Euroglyphus maynei]|uniref:Uncharacterized protein n=1 Tax=Euroglyphus maynei TaxID=6958 RepID=A0A1Y3BNP6_EURMA|nr:hypothetical protein BLA29_004537 [Euroglyphus maynei]